MGVVSLVTIQGDAPTAWQPFIGRRDQGVDRRCRALQSKRPILLLRPHLGDPDGNLVLS
jgi:hypothetical protein